MRNLENRQVVVIEGSMKGSLASVLKYDKVADWVYIDGMIGLPGSSVATIDELVDSHKKLRYIMNAVSNLNM